MNLTADGKTASTDFIADGVIRTVDRPDYASRTTKSYCNGANLMTEINVVRKDNGEILKATELVTVNAAGDMYDSYIGKQGNKDIKFEEVCQRAH